MVRRYAAGTLLGMLLLGLMPVANAQSYAPSTPSGLENSMGKPLVLLRFNQRTIYYEKQLFMAISRAVETKPSVMFDVISMVPQQGNPQTNAQWQAAANSHAQEVMHAMQKMGVPQSRMRYQAQPTAGLKHDEVHIFVR